MSEIDEIKEILENKEEVTKPSTKKKKKEYVDSVKVDIERMYPDVKMPEYSTDGSACVDLRAYRLISLKNSAGSEIMGETKDFEQIAMARGYVAKFGTGIKISAEGWGFNVLSRSGLASNETIIVVNEPGKVDTDYRGEVIVTLCKLYGKPFVISKNDRIAQMEPCRQIKMEFNEINKLSKSSGREEGGIGHTGLK